MRAQSDVYGGRLAIERVEHPCVGSPAGNLPGIEVDAYVLVGPVAAYISGFEREISRKRSLESEVPGLHVTLREIWLGEGEAVRQRRIGYHPAIGDVGKWKKRNPRGAHPKRCSIRRDSGREGIQRPEVTIRSYRPLPAGIAPWPEADPIPASENCLVVEPIGDPKPWGVTMVRVHAHVLGNLEFS